MTVKELVPTLATVPVTAPNLEGFPPNPPGPKGKTGRTCGGNRGATLEEPEVARPTDKPMTVAANTAATIHATRALSTTRLTQPPPAPAGIGGAMVGGYPAGIPWGPATPAGGG